MARTRQDASTPPRSPIRMIRDARAPALGEDRLTPIVGAVASSVNEGRAARVWWPSSDNGDGPIALAGMLVRTLGPVSPHQVRIFATEADPEKLAVARERWSAARCTSLSQYLRPLVLFGEHDVAADPPISNVMAIVCGTPLRELPPPLRFVVLARFHFSLLPGSMLLVHPDDVADALQGPFVLADPGVPILTPRRLDPAERMGLLRAALERAPAREQAAPPPLPFPLDADEANEELQCRLEELALATGELETVNDVLNASNEELRRVNTALQARTVEVVQLSGALEAALARMGVAVLAVDRQLEITAMNASAERLLGVTMGEVGALPLGSLRASLPLRPLLEPVRKCAAGLDVSLELRVKHDDGYIVEVTCSTLLGPDGVPRGALVLMGGQNGGRHV